MASPPERPLADPLLEPDAGPLDASGAPVRAPIGNSIKTLLLLGALVIVGVAVWWVGRPDDLTDRIGGREWVIVDIDGEPAVNDAGTVSTFVLDGNREVRGMVGCNTATGEWDFVTAEQELAIEWRNQTLVGCADDHPETFTVFGGRVDLRGEVMRVDHDDGSVRAVSLADRAVATADELAGEWISGTTTIELGPRGLARVGECPGTWMASGGGISFRWEDADSCDLAPIWADGGVVVPVRFEDSLYLRRDAAPFPLDRDVHRLDLTAPAAG